MKLKQVAIQIMPLLVIVFSYAFTLSLNLIAPRAYNYDEIIVSFISRQETKHLLRTVKAEPHPPGYYFYLKAIPTTNTLQARIISLTATYFFLLAVVFAFRKKLVDYPWLSYGLSIYFSSYTFSRLSQLLKQDSVTMPLFIFLFLLLVKHKTDSKTSKYLFPLIHATVACLLGFGYISYVYGFFLVTIYSLWRRPKFWLQLLLLQLLLVFGYGYSYGYEQLQNNVNRLSWVQETLNSPYAAISSHITGEINASLVGDIYSMFFVTMMFLGLSRVVRISEKTKSLFKKRWEILVVLAIMSVGFIDELHFFGQLRYIALFLFFASIFVGIGFASLRIKSQLKVLILIFFVAISSLKSYTQHFETNHGYEQITKILSIFSEQTGYIADQPLTNVITLQYSHNPKVIPVSLNAPNLLASSNTIEKEHLLLDVPNTATSSAQIEPLLASNNLDNYIYHMNNHLMATYNPNRALLGVFLEDCQKQRILEEDSASTIFLFEDCNFSKTEDTVQDNKATSE